MASTLGQDNPFRYRGYYYDTETGFYYLNARYYNPELGRFISSDNVLDTETAFGCNLFAYCSNDPVNYFDPTGHLKEGLTAEQITRIFESAEYGVLITQLADEIYAEMYPLQYDPFSHIVADTSSAYYNSLNPLANGECTWYAYGRALEKTGYIMPTGDAQTWYDSTPELYRGKELRSNSVAVFKCSKGVGHVIFIECFDPTTGMVKYSEGNYEYERPDGTYYKRTPGVIFEKTWQGILNERAADKEYIGCIYTY